MITDRFVVRAMRPQEIELAADWAASEGWNPGLADPTCFATVDPAGFLLGELAGTPAAIISVINYDVTFAFLGFYIVRPDLRGRGYGWRIWQTGIAHAGSRTIGLDGVLAQQENYKKSGSCLRIGTSVSGVDWPPEVRRRRSRSPRFALRQSRPTMQRCSQLRARPSCAHGSRRPAI